MSELKEFLKRYRGYQVFYTRNIAGDYMENVYNKNEIQVDVCEKWEYIEIFGLSESQKNKICKSGDTL